MNKYIITKHAMQRRPHHKITPKQELIDFLVKLNHKVDFDTLADNKVSKITRKGFCAIIEKRKNKYTLITIRGYKKVDLDNIDLYITGSNTSLGGDKIGIVVCRYNFMGRLVKCGRVGNIYGTDNEKLLVLSPRLKKKYIDLEYNRAGIKFFEDKEVANLVSFDKKKGFYLLNPFEHVIFN